MSSSAAHDAPTEYVPDPVGGAGEVPEKRAHQLSGYPFLVLLLLLLAAAVAAIVIVASSSGDDNVRGGVGAGIGAVALVVLILGLKSLTVVGPNQSAVLQLFGRYTGTMRQDGFFAVNPFSSRRRVSLRVRNFESSVLKVNDLDGNPIEIAAVVVWKVENPAGAVFQVDDFEEFVVTQAETAVRHLATSYPYDRDDDVPSLRSGLDVGEELGAEIQERVARAGVRILESRITHLAYAPEIAQAMLQRQQAGAVVAARGKIVEGAVGMVEMALAKLSERDVVELDEERKAAMVSNLMVVLCGDRGTQPIVNAGSLYQ